MTKGKTDIAIRRNDGVWPRVTLPGSFAVARATSERWTLRTDDGREVELIRREVHVAYRMQPLAALRLTPAQAGWGLGIAGAIAALIAVVAGVIAPNRSVAASAIVDIPRPVPAPAEPGPRVIVQTRYIVAPPTQAVGTQPGTLTEPGDARDVPTALRRAFATNEAQNWATAVASGIVVVGALQIDGGRHCRDVAILTRATDGDSTVNNRYCQTGSDAITVDPASGG